VLLHPGHIILSDSRALGAQQGNTILASIGLGQLLGCIEKFLLGLGRLDSGSLKQVLTVIQDIGIPSHGVGDMFTLIFSKGPCHRHDVVQLKFFLITCHEIIQRQGISIGGVLAGPDDVNRHQIILGCLSDKICRQFLIQIGVTQLIHRDFDAGFLFKHWKEIPEGGHILICH